MPIDEVEFVTGDSPHSHGGKLAEVRRVLTWYLNARFSGVPFEPMLIFGYPGGGKSSIIRSAACDLIAMHPDLDQVEVVTINGSKCLATYPTPDSALLQLQYTIEQHRNEGSTFKIIVLDEVDAIGPTNPHFRNLCHLLMTNLENQANRVAWITITNFPGLIDPAIRSRLSRILYLPCLDYGALQTVIESYLVTSEAQELAEELVKNSFELALTIRGVQQGMSLLQHFGRIKDRHIFGCTASRAAEYVIAGAGAAFVPVTEIETYEYSLRSMIMQSEFLTQFSQAL